MKITKLTLLALLVNDSTAIRIRDEDDGLNLPVLQDTHDLKLDKNIKDSQVSFMQTQKEDFQLIGTFEKQLDQALRNAEQGEMGRALAVSKLQQIKLNIETLESNLKSEAKNLQDQSDKTLEMHQPVEMTTDKVEELAKKTNAILAQIPRINKLEQTLEIQDEDAELAKT